MSQIDVLLIYPQLGSWDDVVRDIPLSLIYAATHSVKQGFKVRILDLRVAGSDWPRLLDQNLSDGPILVGLSVMTGKPILNALKISRYIKETYGTTVVWGGPHPTILPEQTLENSYIDYVIRDWGSKALCGLIEHLKNGKVRKEEILGLGYKEDNGIKLSAPQTCFEVLDWRDLPYHLVDITGESYNRLQSEELIFPIYTAMGCPYKCNFCMAPAVYKKIKGKKWLEYDVDYVLDHIDYLCQEYTINRLQVYDDDSFIDLKRMYELLTGYVRRGLNKNLKLDFRGARIDELDRMDDDFLRLMVKAGVEMLFIGVESGSPRTLKRMNKGITVDQIIRVNEKLAHYPELKPHYNFFCGIPGETLEDLIETKELLLKLVEDHPTCYLGRGGHWKPIPGSVLFEIAVRDYGLKLPSSLEEWAETDALDAKPLVHPWYNPKLIRMIGLLQVTGMVLDAKAEDLTGSMGPILGRLLYFLTVAYRPLLKLRLKYNFTGLMIEHRLRDIAVRRLGWLLRVGNRFTIRKSDLVGGFNNIIK
jgi:radical SAM superfamily enzyme YgiQ (UPF0313 family)